MMKGLIAMLIVAAAISPAASQMRPAPTELKDQDGKEWIDRKARAFLVLSKKTSEENANLIIALLLNEGLQIIGQRDQLRTDQ